MTWLGHRIVLSLGSSIMCSASCSIEILLKYDILALFIFIMLFFFCQINRKRRKCHGPCPPDAQNLIKELIEIYIKNINQNKTEHPISEKIWFTFPPFHPSIPSYTILFISKWARWQSVRKAFSGIAVFLKAKRNKPKHKEHVRKWMGAGRGWSQQEKPDMWIETFIFDV